MQSAKINPESQEVLKGLIQSMLSRKKEYIELLEDDFTKAIVEMAKLHTNYVNVQRRYGK